MEKLSDHMVHDPPIISIEDRIGILMDHGYSIDGDFLRIRNHNGGISIIHVGVLAGVSDDNFAQLIAAGDAESIDRQLDSKLLPYEGDHFAPRLKQYDTLTRWIEKLSYATKNNPYYESLTEADKILIAKQLELSTELRTVISTRIYGVTPGSAAPLI